MIAVKGNTEYTINDSEKDFYINKGFDILNDEGEKIADGEHKNVPFERYKELKADYEKLKAEKGETVDKTKMDELIETNKQLEISIEEFKESQANLAKDIEAKDTIIAEKDEELKVKDAEITKMKKEIAKLKK